ncbi:hypothetical protein H2199_000612 [Coniosporium tulheliwenetii]|uniref:Uncharacterized protein n=1 Tax=Coniosporium tulheliwenetii TaxID=3383036 RepID=A0ACC2ZMC8_9PEZI|nr:hypothetical protein H2199_000612 [Cladosporium sp. JES 115]
MRIRPMLRSDLGNVADVGVQVFHNDNLFRFIYPQLDEHPEDFRRSYLLRMRERFAMPGSYSILAETEEGDQEWRGKTEIAGYAFWERDGGGRSWVGGEQWPLEELESTLLHLESEFEHRLFNRAIDLEHKRTVWRCMDFSFDKVLHGSPYVHLAVLAVSPHCQRRGIGAKLIKWGLERAQKELDGGVPVTLESSPKGYGLYRKMGFVQVARISIEGLPEADDAIAMVWEPEGKEGNWIKGGEEKAKKGECISEEHASRAAGKTVEIA